MKIELILQHNNYLKNLNFLKANEIMNEIKQFKKEEELKKFNEIKNNFLILIEKQKYLFYEKFKKIKENNGNEEMILRSKISDLFHNFQISHISILVLIEKEYLLRYSNLYFNNFK